MNVSVSDDVPTAVDDGAQSVVEGGAQISGNVLGNDTAGADGATLTSVTIGGTEHTVAASGSTPVVTANGTYSFTSAGAWTFTPVASLNSTSAVNAGFSYKITDGDGDTATAVQPISITDGTGPTATDGSASITVAEQGLDNANALGSAEGAAGGAELSPAERGSDTVSFTAGSDAITGMVFGATGGITADVNGIAGADIVWSGAGTSVLTGTINGVAAITVTLVPPALPIAPGANGQATINVQLSDNFPHPAGLAQNTIDLTGITVVASDQDGDSATATVGISVVDDVPTAVADLDSISAGDFTPATGNVISGAGTTNNGVDTLGADGAKVVGVTAGNSGASLDNPLTLGTQITGTFGKLTLNVDGSYSYVRNPGSAGGGNDVFTYTVKDGDGDLAHTTLTISIGDAGPTVSIPGAGSEGTVVYEKGLPERGLESAGTGEMADGNAGNNSDTSETTGGTINFASKDGLSTITLGGHALTTSPQTFVDATGSLTAHYIYDSATGAGSIVYSYTLLDNTSGNNTSATFAVVVTDADGDAAPAGNLVISIVDDAPVLGQFMTAVIPNEVGSVTGTFALQPGADGIANFNITGPAISGISYTTSISPDGTTTLLGKSGNTSVFSLTVASDGTYNFDLIQPKAATNTTVPLAGMSGGNAQFRETSGGLVEFSTTTGHTVNSSGTGFGVDDQRLANSEQFTMEFHNVGQAGNNLPTENPKYVSSVSLAYGDVNLGNSATDNFIQYKWTATNTATNTTDFGFITITNGIAGSLLVNPGFDFNVLTIEGVDGVSGSGKGARFTAAEVGTTILPADQNYDFQIIAVDRDGDSSVAQTLHVDQVAAGSGGSYTLSGAAGDDTIAGSTKADTINGAGGSDIADYTGSTSAVFINLDDNGNASSAATVGSQPEGSIGGGDAAGDTLTGIEGLIGGSGNDLLHGDSGANYLAGGIGNDSLYGESGADSLYGGLDNDALYGGAGSDRMTGGGGSDTFAIDADSLLPGIDDVITDYNYTEGDSVDLTALLGNLPTGTNLDGNFVQVVQDGQNANLQVDTDGSAGNASGWHTVAMLEDFHVSTEVVKILFTENGAPKTQDVS
ncbi:Ig-like domain-containing protein [Sinorhizobium sp. GL28]|uniref:beta strand repeat-containing protein n=1 Tax=Sinorhizobium sp. GL28 TaxID=1358418 RepID=UPI00071C2F42